MEQKTEPVTQMPATGAGNETQKQTGVDERGVPWENKAKELERKHQEAMERVARLEASLQERETERNKPTPDEAEKVKQAKILEFVGDPDGFIERKVKEREMQRESGQVPEWLSKQEGYEPSKDNKRLVEIEREYGLNGSPLQVARRAWQILQDKKLADEFKESRRQSSVSKSSPDGTGKSVAAKTTGNRSELLAQLKAASTKGDMRLEASILDKLEDTR